MKFPPEGDNTLEARDARGPSRGSGVMWKKTSGGVFSTGRVNAVLDGKAETGSFRTRMESPSQVMASEKGSRGSPNVLGQGVIGILSPK